MNHQIYDLIYSDERRAKFIEAFPTAKIEDASDCVHEERFSILLPPEVGELEYYKFLLRNHLAAVSFHFGMALAERRPVVAEAWKQTKVDRSQDAGDEAEHRRKEEGAK